MSKWSTVLGFEIHVELGTNSKMFCGCPAEHFGKAPNSQTCPVCLGLPGALPVPNAKAIEWCVKLGLALDSTVNLDSKFDRKNYFYPDLPKGYQISQYDQPFCTGGSLVLASGKKISITRVHMEEDTGKLQHAIVDGKKVSLVDFNRSGVPLVEIVTEPDFDNPDDGIEFLKEIQAIIRSLGISSADMEKGSMRLEANISVRPEGSKELPDYKIEVKNVNSFRFIKKAIEFEVARQSAILESGHTPKQETRGFSEARGETVAQRSKEEAHDYRYFPEPDIPPIHLDESTISAWKKELPKLPAAQRADLVAAGVSEVSAATIVSSPARLKRFTELSKDHPAKATADLVVNTPEDKVATVEFVEQTLLADPSIIEPVAKRVVEANPKAVADIRSGKTQVTFFLIGQIKKELGDIDIPKTQEILSDIFKSSS